MWMPADQNEVQVQGLQVQEDDDTAAQSQQGDDADADGEYDTADGIEILRPVDLFQTEDQEMGTEPLDGEENNDEADEDSDDIEEDEREGNGPMDIDGDRASRQLLRQMGNIRLMAMKEGMQINTNIPTNLRKEGCAVGPDGELLPADQIDFDHSPSTPTLRSSWLQPGDSSIGSIGGSTPAATTEGIV